MSLNDQKLQAALEYNAARELDRATIELVQRSVGVKVDGKLGPRTTQAIAAFQVAAGLTEDGKLGPKTLAAITSAAQPKTQARLGLWIDDRASVVLSDEYFDALDAMGVSSLALLVHRTTAGSEVTWRPRWSAMQLAQARSLASRRKMDIVLTTWPLPNRALIESFASELPAMLSASGAVALEIDTEGNWLKSRLDGYASLDDAAKALLDTLRSLVEPNRARLELTTYPFHDENGSAALLAPHMDMLFPQAYSVANRRNGAIAWDDRKGPGHLQRFTASRARSIAGVSQGRPRLALGLPAYDQRFAGHAVDEALRVALDTALAENVAEVRYWSSKWVLGSMRGDESIAKFLLGRTGRTAEMPNLDASNQRGSIEFAAADADDDMDTNCALEELRGQMASMPDDCPAS